MRKLIILLALMTGCAAPCECKPNKNNKPTLEDRINLDRAHSSYEQRLVQFEQRLTQLIRKILAEEHLIYPDLPHEAEIRPIPQALPPK